MRPWRGRGEDSASIGRIARSERPRRGRRMPPARVNPARARPIARRLTMRTRLLALTSLLSPAAAPAGAALSSGVRPTSTPPQERPPRRAASAPSAPGGALRRAPCHPGTPWIEREGQRESSGCSPSTRRSSWSASSPSKPSTATATVTGWTRLLHAALPEEGRCAPARGPWRSRAARRLRATAAPRGHRGRGLHLLVRMGRPAFQQVRPQPHRHERFERRRPWPKARRVERRHQQERKTSPPFPGEARGAAARVRNSPPTRSLGRSRRARGPGDAPGRRRPGEEVTLCSVDRFFDEDDGSRTTLRGGDKKRSVRVIEPEALEAMAKVDLEVKEDFRQNYLTVKGTLIGKRGFDLVGVGQGLAPGGPDGLPMRAPRWAWRERGPKRPGCLRRRAGAAPRVTKSLKDAGTPSVRAVLHAEIASVLETGAGNVGWILYTAIQGPGAGWFRKEARDERAARLEGRPAADGLRPRSGRSLRGRRRGDRGGAERSRRRQVLEEMREVNEIAAATAHRRPPWKASGWPAPRSPWRRGARRASACSWAAPRRWRRPAGCGGARLEREHAGVEQITADMEVAALRLPPSPRRRASSAVAAAPRPRRSMRPAPRQYALTPSATDSPSAPGKVRGGARWAG